MSKLIKHIPGVEWYDDGTILVMRCPKCHRENYCMAVADGVCCWCGYKPEKIKEQCNARKDANSRECATCEKGGEKC